MVTMNTTAGKARGAAQRAEAIGRQILTMNPPRGGWRAWFRHADAVARLRREAARLRRLNGTEPSLSSQPEGEPCL